MNEKSSKIWRQKMKKSHLFTNYDVHDCNQSILVKCIFEDFLGPIQFKLKICSKVNNILQYILHFYIEHFIKFESTILTLFSIFRLNCAVFCKTTMNAYMQYLLHLGQGLHKQVPTYIIQILKLFKNLKSRHISYKKHQNGYLTIMR